MGMSSPSRRCRNSRAPGSSPPPRRGPRGRCASRPSRHCRSSRAPRPSQPPRRRPRSRSASWPSPLRAAGAGPRGAGRPRPPRSAWHEALGELRHPGEGCRRAALCPPGEGRGVRRALGLPLLRGGESRLQECRARLDGGLAQLCGESRTVRGPPGRGAPDAGRGNGRGRARGHEVEWCRPPQRRRACRPREEARRYGRRRHHTRGGGGGGDVLRCAHGLACESCRIALGGAAAHTSDFVGADEG
mmetsp:Transcript_67321/g.219287  ORF Transcript_67321/g.219287 Transcript_67321/m.219287 type:complete len:245 (-) Transcript_67321:236-970(-)